MLSRSIRSALHTGDGASNEPHLAGRITDAALLGGCEVNTVASAPSRAAAGQGGLMGLYDTLFSQYGITCGQVLVTERDFSSETRRRRVRSTLEVMLQVGSVPVINENDVLAVPDRRKLFSDNDSLAVLVATELKSDVLMLGSDVPGIFRGPPEPGQPPDVLPIVTRSTPLSFGAKSARGRGGMQAKVEAALSAIERGVSAVVIFSGFEPLGVLRILKGEPLGTLLLSEAEAKLEMKALRKAAALAAPAAKSPAPAPAPAPVQPTEPAGPDPDALASALAAREASRALQRLSHEERGKVLHACADALEAAYDVIAKANAADVAAASKANMSAASAARLHLPLKKLKGVTAGLRDIAKQPDPLWRTKRHVELAPGLVLRQETVPIGVILVIFESRPDVVPQVAALAIASGNGLLLKGGKEAARTNAVLHSILASTVERATSGRVKGSLLGLVETRAQIGALLQLQGAIDLVIPRGSNAMVQHIMSSTKIPTLGHADGVCHMYVDAAADPAKAERLMLDAKTDYPAACNALETLLVHQSAVGSGLATRLCEAARKAGIKLFGGPHACQLLINERLEPAADLHTEYGELAMCVEVVAGLAEAVEHIHTYGSSHTEVIVTEDPAAAEAFLSSVDAANVFHNASSRFADGYRFGLGAEVGISTSRIHARGPVGVEGLLTTRNRVVSTSSHTVGDFSSGKVTYTHQTLTSKL